MYSKWLSRQNFYGLLALESEETLEINAARIVWWTRLRLHCKFPRKAFLCQLFLRHSRFGKTLKVFCIISSTKSVWLHVCQHLTVMIAFNTSFVDFNFESIFNKSSLKASLLWTNWSYDKASPRFWNESSHVRSNCWLHVLIPNRQVSWENTKLLYKFHIFP